MMSSQTRHGVSRDPTRKGEEEDLLFVCAVVLSNYLLYNISTYGEKRGIAQGELRALFQVPK